MLGFALFCLLCAFSQGSATDLGINVRFANDAIDLQCDTNSDCEFAVSGSVCVDKKCECSPGFALNAQMSACIKVVAGYGEPCVESVQCSRYLFTGGTCVKGICVCSEGYYYMHGRCNAYSGLNGKCKKNEDCYVIGDVEATSCVDGVCKCSEGYYQREHRSCRHAAKAGDDRCVLDNDCMRFSNKTTSYCAFDGRCAESQIININPTFFHNKNVDHEIDDEESSQTISDVVIGVKCKINEECEDFGSAYCDVTGKCVCKRGNFFNQGVMSCSLELGEPCDPKDNATIGYSECRNGIWSCERHRVPDHNNRICLRAIRRLNDTCLRDVQCYAFGPDAICQDTSCVCNAKSRYDEKEQFCWTKRGIGESCEEDVDCFVDGMVSRLRCSNRVCSCPNGTHANRHRTECVSDAGQLGDRCEYHIDCATIHSKCSYGFCACLPQYYESNNTCLLGIGANCTVDNDCGPVNSECFSNTACICSRNFVSTSAATCVRAPKVGENCTTDIQCAFGTSGAVCVKLGNNSTQGVCACAAGRHYVYNVCYDTKLLGEKCKWPGECLVNPGGNATCTNNRCVCDWGYKRRDKYTCIKNSGDAIKTSLLALLPILLTMFKYSL